MNAYGHVFQRRLLNCTVRDDWKRIAFITQRHLCKKMNEKKVLFKLRNADKRHADAGMAGLVVVLVVFLGMLVGDEEFGREFAV